jgi:uncharacterized protein YdeI (YjbR/CyaY-like superfamily)
MGTRDQRIDVYIADSSDFARPILSRLRTLVHEACPEVEETIKWRHPTFMWHGMLCAMAAFKGHCTFGFWKNALLVREGGTAAQRITERMGRIAALAELPPAAVIRSYVRRAMRLNELGTRMQKRPTRPKRPLVVPADLNRALARNRKAREAFEGFSPSHRREYVEWITEAKQEATRLRRLDTAIAWLAEGKPRNWKYMGKC